jgi:NAD(P)H-hydrate epimerase
MKLFDSHQIRKLDKATVAHEAISSLQLMERAAKAFVAVFKEKADIGKPILILCGPGNNGGDGYAIGRMLKDGGKKVRVLTYSPSGRYSSDAQANLDRLAKDQVSKLGTKADLPFDLENWIVIDALFGTGLSRALSSELTDVVSTVNSSKAEIFAVDIATGLSADGVAGHPPIIRPTYTVTFQFPKLAFLLPENEVYVGEWIAADIRLSEEAIAKEPTPFSYFTEAEACKLYRPRQKFDHKGVHGRGLIVAGSHGKMGAAILAAQGASRSGIGLLTCHIPACGYGIIQTSVPEAMAQVDHGDEVIGQVSLDIPDTSIGIGPGIGQAQKTAQALHQLLEAVEVPIVLDADALNILGNNRQWLGLIPEGSVLTPHLKEFERLTGVKGDSLERLKEMSDFSKQYGVIVVLKGAHSAISHPDGRISFNSTGNPGMAKGGSGDVLTGVVMALLAKGYTPWDAARLGVFAHGMAGDNASLSLGVEGMNASDLVGFLPKVWQYLTVSQRVH